MVIASSTDLKSCMRNSVATIYARAGPDAGFKRCCNPMKIRGLQCGWYLAKCRSDGRLRRCELRTLMRAVKRDKCAIAECHGALVIRTRADRNGFQWIGAREKSSQFGEDLDDLQPLGRSYVLAIQIDLQAQVRLENLAPLTLRD